MLLNKFIRLIFGCSASTRFEKWLLSLTFLAMLLYVCAFMFMRILKTIAEGPAVPF